LPNLWNRTAFCAIFLAIAAVLAGAQTDQQRNFPRFNFNVGGGYGIGRGDAGAFVGNSWQGTAGAGLNFNKWFGVSAEYMYYDLSFRPSVAIQQHLNNASGSLNAVSLNGIIRPPYHMGPYGFYGIFGLSGFVRNTYASTGDVNLATCQPSWRWWDIYCFDGRVPAAPPTVSIGSNTKLAGGYNYGIGLTYGLNRWHHAKVYAEFRYEKPYFSDSAMPLLPFTVGLRW
jgi:hypothetical protein